MIIIIAIISNLLIIIMIIIVTYPIAWTVLGMINEVIKVQPWKAFGPIDITFGVNLTTDAQQFVASLVEQQSELVGKER